MQIFDTHTPNLVMCERVAISPPSTFRICLSLFSVVIFGQTLLLLVHKIAVIRDGLSLSLSRTFSSSLRSQNVMSQAVEVNSTIILVLQIKGKANRKHGRRLSLCHI